MEFLLPSLENLSVIQGYLFPCGIGSHKDHNFVFTT